jgi:hypothetical protein
MTTIHLNGHHQKTLDAIRAHPTPHNVEWHDVLSLLGHLGTVTERHNGAFDVRIGHHGFVLDRPKGHDVTGDQIRALQKFLTQKFLASTDQSASPDTSARAGGRPCIVLIDHHQAKLFDLDEAHDHAAAPKVHVPEDGDGSRRRLEHRQGNDDHDGGHSSEDSGYYEAICGDLEQAGPIVVLSDGQGRSSAGDYLVGYVRRHHAGIAVRIVATDRIDISHVSDSQAVAAGRALLGGR